MAPMKFVCLLLVLICTAWLSLAHSSQDRNAGTEVNAVSSEKGFLEDERAAAACTKKRIKGRKMAMGNIMKQEKKKEHGAVAGTSNISSSNQVAGKYESEEGKNGSNVERKLSVTRSSEEIVEAGFVAFTADYHEPRHHPPKNN